MKILDLFNINSTSIGSLQSVFQIIQSNEELHNLEFVGSKGQNQLLIFRHKTDSL